ncbi:MAG TPA: ThiF family adenylyltransferase [Candidatus Magasanikbacteria bacterium]|jgi:hypothetical protein|nr:hypothetical protein [Candidatus Magasanikbacteria bacterium]HQF57467.1 ThiF family adenylyltransferase [Candidatus Magasanikbacteria bacterium]
MMDKPIKLNIKEEKIADFKKRFLVNEVFDSFEEQLKELFLIRNPHFRFESNYQSDWLNFLNDYLNGEKIEEKGNWFYFPWSKNLVHYLPEMEHQELRTARNRNIITKEEQEKLYNSTLGFLGLSVGSHVVLTLIMMGIGKRIKLADPDTISASNLNRIRADITSFGVNKCEFIARQIYQINPYLEIEIYANGVNEENIEAFINQPQKIQVLIEEVDNLEVKISSRLAAKKNSVPVVMATDNGDNVIVDIERYDEEKDLELFNGAIGKVTIEEFKNFSPQELPRLATKIAGPRLITARMQDSLLEVGKSIYSWPQMGNAATLAGVSLSYVVKRILLGESLVSGKKEVNLDAIFQANYNDSEVVKIRNQKIDTFLKIINL